MKGAQLTSTMKNISLPTVEFDIDDEKTSCNWRSDMEFVKQFTPPDFQAKNFTPSISPNFNSFSDKNTKK